MSKHIHYIYAVLFGGLLIAMVISFHNNNVLESRLNTLNKLSPSEDSEKTFKEDYYITQQSNDTSLILTCFGLGFALFSFFTYQSVVRSVADEVSRMKKNYKAHKDDYNVQHNRLIKLEIDLKNEIAQSYEEKAISFTEMNPPSLKEYILYELLSCEKRCEAFGLIVDENNYYKDSIYKIIVHQLESLDFAISDLYDIQHVDPTRHARRVESIHKVIKQEDMNLFHRVFSKITINQTAGE